MQPLSLLTTMMAVARPLRWIAFFSLFLNLSYLAAPLYMMQVYDRVMHSQSVPTLLYLTLVIALAYLVFAILDGVRGQILAGVSDIVEDTLAARLLQSATSPAERGKNRPQPAHIGRDLDIVRQFAAGSAVLAFIDLPFSALYLSVLFLLHWVLGAFAAASAVLLLGLSVAAERSARSPMATAGRVAGQAYQFGDSLARHADCASTMGLAATLAARWRTLRGAMLAAQNLASSRAVLLGSATKFVRMFTQSAILGLGAYLAIHHDISGGAVFAGSLLLGRFLAPIESMTAAWRSTLAAADAFTRIRSTSSATTQTYLRLPAPMGAIGLERISWTPPGAERAALIEISLNIEPGAVLAIVGPNAAGKSTLGRVFAGAIRGDEGIARLDGAEFTAWDPAQIGQAIGYLPQEVSLFPGTIRDNIARFGDASDDDVVAAATRAMAHEMINRLPNGYQTLINDSTGGLSGGQRQRVALARAMLGDPPVLVLDEPNASLDAEGEAGLFKAIIAARQRQRTVVMITHSTALVRLADYVATMVGGRVLRVQKATEFFARPTPVPVAAVG